MFAGWQGSGDRREGALDFFHEALAPLVAAVSALLENAPAAGPPAAVAMAVWGQVHGLVSLELSGVGLSMDAWTDANEAALSSIARAYVGS